MIRQIIVGALILACCSAQAEPVPLGDEALIRTLSGRTVHLDTPIGIVVPITFQTNGLMFGKAGVLSYFLGGETDRGRWWVTDGKLCQKWFKWLDAQPSCMRLAQDGNRIYWRRDDGVNGTATIVSAQPPGAEASRNGLGAPIRTPTPQLPTTAEPLEEARPKSIPTAVAHSIHRADAAEVKAAAHVPQKQQLFARADVWPKPRYDNGLVGARRSATSIGAHHRWCDASIPMSLTLEPDAVPDLVFFVRAHYSGREEPPPIGACLTAEPVLRQVAKLAIGRK
jgi:hypothetical protein